MSDFRSKSRAGWAVGMMACAALVAGCGEDGDDVVFQVIEEVTFDASLGIDLTQMTVTNNGIYYLDEVDGTGRQLQFGTYALIDYEGWLADGTQFDMGRIDYLMGNNEVVRGLEDGSLAMLEGGTRLIIIPPLQGYGAAGRGGVPPGAIMVFRISLVSVTDTPPTP